MGVSLSYSDSYLKTLMLEDVEDRATEDILNINADFPEPWKTKLIVVRAYILTCIENCKAQDDLFSVKRKAYETEYKNLLQSATNAYNALNSNTGFSYMSINLERA